MAPAVPHRAGTESPSTQGDARGGSPGSLHWGQHRVLAQPASRVDEMRDGCWGPELSHL